MSVTFYPAERSRYVGEDEAVLDSVDCYLFEECGINFANLNAGRVLEALGFSASQPEDFMGEARAEDFLGRVLLALAISPEDEAIPSYELQRDEYSAVVSGLVGSGDAKVWMGARPAGDLQDKLRALRTLGEFCQEHKYIIVWE